MLSTSRNTDADPETVVAEPAWIRYGSWLGCPLLAAGAGWLVKEAAEWLVTLPWLPVPGPVALAASIPHGTLVALVLGALAGLAFAFLWARERLSVIVSREAVALKRDGTSREFAGTDVGAVFQDSGELVLLAPGGNELAREESDLPFRHLREAFLAHAYAWCPEGDPHATEYQLWVQDAPGLPSGAGAVLKAREQALRKNDKKEATVLRAELIKLGIVVRDEDKRQYWRHGAQR
ncbi:hypothetical protein FHX42_001880 [Saccharopolyspora lacisalsi]|uniref:DUF308 domain-containing protein n=1 Tax=Halosaccharopolyspora lacisalsi TaxID=1000566 RepID=A0A839DU16_9PSEU|nr:hypothetical protein [Halosaccharopolyspora lacisalsi]MBA8824533.1 hypothetical protein [Halosaccharopolyspora lacisalsi]